MHMTYTRVDMYTSWQYIEKTGQEESRQCVNAEVVSTVNSSKLPPKIGAVNF